MPTNNLPKADTETGEIPVDPFASDGAGGQMPEGTFLAADQVKIDDAFSRLLDLVDRDVVGWRPNPGDRIFGVVADITEGNSEYGTYPLIVIDTPQSEDLIGVHCFHATLKRDVEANMIRQTLVIGSQIAISYRGEGTATRGNSAPNLYRLAVIPPAA